MKKAKKATKTASEHPALWAWLTENNARCNSQSFAGEACIETWLVRGSMVITHCDDRGWNIYTGLETNNIEESLADAKHRIGRITPLRFRAEYDEEKRHRAAIAQLGINIAEGGENNPPVERGSRVYEAIEYFCAKWNAEDET